MLLLNRLQLAGGINCNVPRAWLLPYLLVLIFEPINTKSHCDIEIGAFFQDSSYVRKDSLMNLSVGHDVDRLELIVVIESARDLRQVFARKRLATGENQNPKIPAQRLRDSFDFVGLHLELLARAVVKLVGEKAMCAAHVTHRSHQNIQQNRRERLSQSQLRITLQKLSCCVIHFNLKALFRSRANLTTRVIDPRQARPKLGSSCPLPILNAQGAHAAVKMAAVNSH